jgi:hypothetical protein
VCQTSLAATVSFWLAEAGLCNRGNDCALLADVYAVAAAVGADFHGDIVRYVCTPLY